MDALAGSVISFFDEFIDRVIIYLRQRRILEGIRTALGRIDKDRSVSVWNGIGRCRISNPFLTKPLKSPRMRFSAESGSGLLPVLTAEGMPLAASQRRCIALPENDLVFLRSGKLKNKSAVRPESVRDTAKQAEESAVLRIV